MSEPFVKVIIASNAHEEQCQIVPSGSVTFNMQHKKIEVQWGYSKIKEIFYFDIVATCVVRPLTTTIKILDYEYHKRYG